MAVGGSTDHISAFDPFFLGTLQIGQIHRK